MITVRRGQERGVTRLRWLDSRHTFSFGGYGDPRWNSYRALRVLNDDRVAPGGGFPTHSHRDMEILTWVLAGALAHEDSLGHRSTLQAGELQRMTAGTGIAHSEFNASATEPVHFLQVWIQPERRGLAPGYQQIALEAGGGVRLAASRDGGAGALAIHQDVRIHVARLAAGDEAELALAPGRYAWIQAAAGAVSVNGIRLEAGDGAALEDAGVLRLEAAARAEVLLFDLA